MRGSAGDATALAVEGVSKAFPGTRALDDVSLRVVAGEIHGLCGGNGSGKSTLIKILCGVYQGDSGSVEIEGTKLDATEVRPNLAHDAGLRVVHQDFAVFPDLSVAENLVLGAEFPISRAGNVRWRELHRRAQTQIDRFEIRARPETLVRDLPVGARSQIAIARATQDLGNGEGVLILDEPTVALPAHDVEILLTTVRRLASAGHAVIFVSHRLDEVMQLTDRVTVLRDGQVAADHQTSQLTERALIESILGGRTVSTQSKATAASLATAKTPLLKVSGLEAAPLRNVDLEVMPGEVVGVAGLLGSGRSELLRAVYGDMPIEAGTVTLDGRTTSISRSHQAIELGIVMIPEDRVSGASFADLSVDENLDVSVLRDFWHGWFNRRRMKSAAASLRASYKVKAARGGVEMRSLSGGNQQKAIMARWLRREPRLLLLDEPTQGVDVGARADIYAAVRKVTEGGGAAILVLSDLEEMSQVVDRAVVLRGGVVTAHVSGDRLNAHVLNELIISEGRHDHERQA